jgi:hypothetical protein
MMNTKFLLIKDLFLVKIYSLLELHIKEILLI